MIDVRNTIKVLNLAQQTKHLTNWAWWAGHLTNRTWLMTFSPEPRAKQTHHPWLFNLNLSSSQSHPLIHKPCVINPSFSPNELLLNRVRFPSMISGQDWWEPRILYLFCYGRSPSSSVVIFSPCLPYKWSHPETKYLIQKANDSPTKRLTKRTSHQPRMISGRHHLTTRVWVIIISFRTALT